MDKKDLYADCPSCNKRISIRAKKCPGCDSELGMELGELNAFADPTFNDKRPSRGTTRSNQNSSSIENQSVIHLNFTKSNPKSKRNLLGKFIFVVTVFVVIAVLLTIWRMQS